MKVPAKVKTFLWRACSNILPTRDNLFRRKIQIDQICELCRQMRETCAYMLWECPFAQNVWAMMKGRVQRSAIMKCRIFFIFFDIWGQANKKGTRIVGCSVMGSLECKKQSLFWESPSTAKDNCRRGIAVTGNISVGCFSSKCISLDEDYYGFVLL